MTRLGNVLTRMNFADKTQGMQEPPGEIVVKTGMRGIPGRNTKKISRAGGETGIHHSLLVAFRRRLSLLLQRRRLSLVTYHRPHEHF
jgi:hypothetical protein